MKKQNLPIVDIGSETEDEEPTPNQRNIEIKDHRQPRKSNQVATQILKPQSNLNRQL